MTVRLSSSSARTLFQFNALGTMARLVGRVGRALPPVAGRYAEVIVPDSRGATSWTPRSQKLKAQRLDDSRSSSTYNHYSICHVIRSCFPLRSHGGMSVRLLFSSRFPMTLSFQLANARRYSTAPPPPTPAKSNKLPLWLAGTGTLLIFVCLSLPIQVVPSRSRAGHLPLLCHHRRPGQTQNL